MQSSTRKSSSSSTSKSSSSSSKAAKQSSKLGTTTLYNIHDDVLQIMLQRLTIKQLLEIYITNTAFSDKGINFRNGSR
jgi:BRCT domain type II-containing protein